MQKTVSLQHQLGRVRGQVEGIGRMIEEDRDCLDVVQQILAARNSLGRIGREYLTKEAVRCATSASRKKDFDAVLKQLFTL